MKLIFANVLQGFVYASDLGPAENIVYRRFSIPEYVEYFRKQSPAILCLAEVLIDNEHNDSDLVESVAEACQLPYQ